MLTGLGCVGAGITRAGEPAGTLDGVCIDWWAVTGGVVGASISDSVVVVAASSCGTEGVWVDERGSRAASLVVVTSSAKDPCIISGAVPAEAIASGPMVVVFCGLPLRHVCLHRYRCCSAPQNAPATGLTPMAAWSATLTCGFRCGVLSSLWGVAGHGQVVR
jgi:hypothetical protein